LPRPPGAVRAFSGEIMKSIFKVMAMLLPLFGVPACALASCGSAFCLVNTNWDTHGAWSQPGLRLDLRYETINQNQLQEGGHRIAIAGIPRDHDEVQTVNRNWLASLDYTFNPDWGINVSLPLVNRTHLHIENDADAGTQTPESWKFSNLGDVRAVARYRLASFESADHKLGTVGLNFGLKLATGRFDMQNANGDRAERPLQPGSGTTDGLLGAYYAQVLPMRDLSWFAQGLLQVPLNSREAFKPGRRLALDAGLRYDASEQVSLILQVNALYKSRDSGINAEPGDSGGRSLHLSPGVSIAASQDVRIYGFLQAPLFQYVNGVQLVARRAAVLGVSTKF
jgi:hypothetical protein